MKIWKKVTGIIVTVSLIAGLTACSGGDKETKNEAENLVIAYQSSIAYAPLVVMKEQKLIEKYYGKDLSVDWKIMANGSAINDGITAGSVDVGAMGVAPAITGMKAGIPYKIFAGMSSQPYGILTNKKEINSLKDITSDDQIAITNINSQPHILLAMAAKAELGNARALDGNLTVLANADGYSSILSGAVSCHMVISPYNFMELENEKVHEIEVGEDVWPNGNTFIVGVASIKLKEEKPELYDALCKAMEEAVTYIDNNQEATAKLIAQDYDASEKEILSWMQDEGSNYTTKLQGVMELSNFMVEEGFLENGPKDIREIAFDNVQGE